MCSETIKINENLQMDLLFNTIEKDNIIIILFEIKNLLVL